MKTPLESPPVLLLLVWFPKEVEEGVRANEIETRRDEAAPSSLSPTRTRCSTSRGQRHSKNCVETVDNVKTNRGLYILHNPKKWRRAPSALTPPFSVTIPSFFCWTDKRALTHFFAAVPLRSAGHPDTLTNHSPRTTHKQALRPAALAFSRVSFGNSAIRIRTSHSLNLFFPNPYIL